MIIQKGRFRLSIYFKTLEKRTGVCSQKDTFEDKHALLWDFDITSIRKIIPNLVELQQKYQLPNIYIIRTSTKSYHAYSFTARPFMAIIHILSDTPYIDINYFKLGIIRGYYTLRITPRKGERFKLIRVIKSPFPNELEPNTLTVNEYMTSNKGWHGRKNKRGRV